MPLDICNTSSDRTEDLISRQRPMPWTSDQIQGLCHQGQGPKVKDKATAVCSQGTSRMRANAGGHITDRNRCGSVHFDMT